MKFTTDAQLNFDVTPYSFMGHAIQIRLFADDVNRLEEFALYAASHVTETGAFCRTHWLRNFWIVTILITRIQSAVVRSLSARSSWEN